MKIANQRYYIAIPGYPEPVRLLGLQEYSPGQSSRVDVWQIQVPKELQDKLQDGWEASSYPEALRTIARAFFGGDESRVMPASIPSGTCGKA
jgi:hypothetical protein